MCCRWTSFVPGEIFIVRNDMGDGWLWVTSKSTGLSGIVNRELVKDLVSLVATVCLTPTELLHNCSSIISSPQNICLYITPDCRRVFCKLMLHFRHRVGVCHIVLPSVFLNAFLQIFARKIIYHLIQGIISLSMHGKTLTLMLDSAVMFFSAVDDSNWAGVS